MKYTFLISFLCCTMSLMAQDASRLISYFSFNNNNLIEESGNGQNGIFSSTTPIFACGVDGDALFFNGSSDRLTIFGLNNNLTTKDFTLSFYVKPEPTLSGQAIISKSEFCNNDNAFEITYFPSLETIKVLMSENSSKKIEFNPLLDQGACWYHVVVVRDGAANWLYINGELIRKEDSVTSIDLTNSSELVIGGGPCISPSVLPFNGLLDDFRIYEYALEQEEIDNLYFNPDEVAISRDTLVFLGASVQMDITNSCSSSFSWFPATGVDDIFAPDPIITPTETTTYTINFNHGSCVSQDSVVIIVVDPDDLNCNSVFLPSAFTPNGDGRNDVYGLSLPAAVEELISFEIFDRWGGRVFHTTDATMTWDGSFGSEPMNPGVFLYRLHFKCGDNEETKVGSVTLMR